MNKQDNIRITLKRIRPNPLFHRWLEEIHEEAKCKKSKLEKTLEEALDSLSKYPLPLKSGAECGILKGFDKQLCKFLDNCLEVYNNKDQETLPELRLGKGIVKESLPNECNRPLSPVEENIPSDPYDDISKQASPKKTSTKSYRPLYKSGAYAILIALLEHLKENSDNSKISKNCLIEKAQVYSEESFTRPKPNTRYTAWSSMNKLVSKGLVNKNRNKTILYSLSEQGISLATELFNEYKDKQTVNDIIFNNASSSRLNNVKEHEVYSSNENSEAEDRRNKSNYIKLLPGSFNIILLIDKNEINGLHKKNNPTIAQFNKYPDLIHLYRSLKLGDFIWVAQHKTDENIELVLPYIVERKRMDDLGASIKDGRFHEQKYRLRKCGLNVIYLVENYGSNKHVGLPMQHLMQALANTRVQDDFKVHITDSLSNSARFLAMFTKRLTQEYKNKELTSCEQEPSDTKLMTFTLFNKSFLKTKTLTVTQMFTKLLLQLKGVSVPKALAITNIYKTPKQLIEAYKRCHGNDGESLLVNVDYNGTRHNIGRNVSRTIYQLFTKNNLCNDAVFSDM